MLASPDRGSEPENERVVPRVQSGDAPETEEDGALRSMRTCAVLLSSAPPAASTELNATVVVPSAPTVTGPPYVTAPPASRR